MGFTKIISIVLGIFAVLLIIVPLFFDIDSNNNNSNDLNNLKDVDTNKILDKNNLKERGTGISKKTKDIKNNLENFSENMFLSSETRVVFCPEDNCDLELNNLIEDSKESIYCGVYDLSLKTVSDKLVDAKDRGLDVKFVTENKRTRTQLSQVHKLKANDLNVLVSENLDKYIFHNKFCVFDSKTLWIGSANFTLNGFYKNNNNALIIENKKLAKRFEEYLVGFYKNGFSNDLLEREINSIKNIEYYFCPKDDCYYHFLRFLKDTNKSLDCMYFSLTLDEFTNRVSSKDIDSRIILEENNLDLYSEYYALKDKNINVLLDENEKSMHNKFCVFDNEIVMTGSMNMSVSGTKSNDESIVFIKDKEIAKKYTNYFNKYYNDWSN